MRKKTALVAVFAAATALTLSACSGEGSGKDSDSSSVAEISAPKNTKPGTVLDQPFQKPALVLTDTQGKPYDLRERTKGKPTLLFFGYTSCPDVCPLTMSNLAMAKKKLPQADQEKLQVVFVTTDPERDTPAQLGKWLPSAGDPSFTGLSGDFAKIQAAARSVGIGIDPPKKEKDGSVSSMHGAQVMAFSPKTDQGYVVYGEDTTPEAYAKDLPKLLRGEKP
ncbi:MULTISPECIES: SCO family protein [Streptomyces]|uniref:SCO family protein n=1 Tax=Streptomyces tsukubensis (strain DSM 42081 / NBRC 108919 / NRRL 18488 / 9993) TaxID=1114943 RepID=I2N1V7_STRT9|nr:MULTISPECIES: SCO family protein [Streptomyces]AZK95141.1 SCO family protein [Streptomyces tsukubensis]EIF91004.1 electron transport protein SCO1/SenC [Streptomyces tsukubensis NRRL18488]MYS64154.1 redoxin domain-containing protein [Streptomyces sp. SID5473]QKM68795.1 SCO family protein [Streptomyces tsukubensis NRRL18488]TAI43600.1 SCO family protein [Streptomyces tsukubensis]